MEYEIVATDAFTHWFKTLRSATARQKVLARFARIENGNLVDFKRIDRGLFELRFHFGSGLRVYYTIQENRIVLLLKGGDKSSQKKDITQAKRLLHELGDCHD